MMYAQGKRYRKKMEEGGDTTGENEVGINPPPEEGSETEDPNAAIKKTMEERAGLGDKDPTLPAGTKFEPVLQEQQEDEIIDTDVELKKVELEAEQASTEDLEISTP